MRHFLLLAIRFHDGRFHGVPDWPPSPARVFQALAAAAARGATIPDGAKAALEWLETIDAPVIAAPTERKTKGFTNFVPNNDLDAVGGDVRRIGEIRAPKFIRPRLFDSKTPLLYAWTFKEAGNRKKHADEICNIAQDLYQLGRGVDMAWAQAEILSQEEAGHRLAAHGGSIHRPASHGIGAALACPALGSLESLIDRHKAASRRFVTQTAPAPTKKEPNKQKVIGQLFRQPPRPRFRQVVYDCPPTRLLYDLSPPGAAWPFTQAAALVERVRDAAASRLSAALPAQNDLVQRIFIGSKQSSEADKAERLRIIPLPSIGHQHADRAIRRILVEVPPNCPLAAGDIEWAFSGLDISEVDATTGEVLTERMLTGAAGRKMLEHYGVEAEAPSRIWRTVTPAALPDHARRRRIDPARRKEEAKGGAERRSELERAASSVQAALRHAGITAELDVVRLQREPFEARGARAEEFASGTRFSKHQLWHIELSFAEPIVGPLAIGDGRYLGLGLFQPEKEVPETAFFFEIAGRERVSAGRRNDFLRAVRRALMALDRDHGEGGSVSRLFSGHEDDGAPARSGTHEHVFLAATGENGVLTGLLVLSPALADRRTKLRSADRARFAEIVRRLELIRAGELGVIKIVRTPLDDEKSLMCASREWQSETAYIPTRHIKSKDDPAVWLTDDVLRECARRGIPRPKVEILSIQTKGKTKPNANVRLVFQVPVKGPILLGQGAHFGSGLFRAGFA